MENETMFKNINNNNLESNKTNKNVRKLEFDKGYTLSYDFTKNNISNIDYSIFKICNILIKSIFSSPLKIMILAICFIYLISTIALGKKFFNLRIYYVFSVQILLIILCLFKEIINILKVDYNDSIINNQFTYIYDPDLKGFITMKWKDVRVGNIIKINKDNICPADIVILETLDSNHNCYVDESSITGIYDNFKIKTACKDTQTPIMKPIKINEYIKNIKGVINYEEPNGKINSFFGRFKLESFPRACDVTIENFIMRGSTLKNTKCVYGLVVYTGMESKIMQLLSKSEKINTSKKNKDFLNKTLNIIQLVLIIFYVVIVFNFAILLYSKTSKLENFYKDNNKFSKSDNRFTIYNSLYFISNVLNINPNNIWEEYVFCLLQFCFIIHLCIPYIWYNLITICYYVQSKLIKWDNYLREFRTNLKIDVINYNSLAELGKIKYIISDKTGTITKRKFNLKCCLVGREFFSFDSNMKINNTNNCFNNEIDFDDLKLDKNYIFQTIKDQKLDIELCIEKEYNLINSISSVNKNLKKPFYDFFECICLCNSLKVKKNSNLLYNSQTIGANFSDEKAMNKVLNMLGFVIDKIKSDKISLFIRKQLKNFYIIGRNKYSEERKRMSIIYKDKKNSNNSVLLCKGSDFNILNCLNLNEEYRIYVLEQIKKMSNLGCRYFIYSKKLLFEDDTTSFITKYKSAENNKISRDLIFENLAKEYENDMEYLGILFYKEDYDDSLQYNICKLNNAGIKTWILSGDRKENVVSFAKSIDIVNKDNNILDLSRELKIHDIGIKMDRCLMQFSESYYDNFPTKDFESEELSIVKNSTINNKLISLSNRSNCFTKKYTASKEIFFFLDGECFSIIYHNVNLFQSFIVLLSYTKCLFGYSFSPINKSLLVRIMQNYILNNSSLLAIGDGLNDSMMLKEANFSIGIKSKEVIQLRNTCDIIVYKFSQISELILVHGTWIYYRCKFLCFYSIYSSTIIIFSYFINSNNEMWGFVFTEYFYGLLIIQLLLVNFSLILIISYDQNVERSLINSFPFIYGENYNTKSEILIESSRNIITAIIDSLIINTIISNNTLSFLVNSLGQNSSKLLLELACIISTILTVYIKLIFLKIKKINIINIFTSILFVILIYLSILINLEEKIIINEIYSYLNLMFSILLSIFLCYILEYVIDCFKNLYIPLLSNTLTKIYTNYINSKKIYIYKLVIIYLDLNCFYNFSLSLIDISSYSKYISNKDISSTLTVAKKYKKHNQNLDYIIDQSHNIDNHKLIELKLTPNLCFTDLKLETEYKLYFLNFIRKIFIIYIFINILYFICEIVFVTLSTKIITYIISISLKILWLISSFLLLIPKLSYKFSNYYVYNLAFGYVINIFCIYLENQLNSLKIATEFIFLSVFGIIFMLRNFKHILVVSFAYIALIIPSIFLNDTKFVQIIIPFINNSSSQITNNKNIKIQEDKKLNYNLNLFSSYIIPKINEISYEDFAFYNYRYSSFINENLVLLVSATIIISISITIIFIYGYNEEKYSRVNYLKIYKKKMDFKKDQEIFDNLVPKFVQERMESSNRGASIDEERVSVLFADICDFDQLVADMPPEEFINLLDKIYSTFDQLCSIHGLQKIETVGKTYMAAGGLRECEKDLDPNILNSKNHTDRIFELALDIIDLISNVTLEDGKNLQIKIGVHTNEVNAAVVGNHKPQFSLIGDTVNTTARMCGNSKENCILITQEAYDNLTNKKDYNFDKKELMVKGKGIMITHLYNPIKSKVLNIRLNKILSFLLKNSNLAVKYGVDKDENDKYNSSFILDNFNKNYTVVKDRVKPLNNNGNNSNINTIQSMQTNANEFSRISNYNVTNYIQVELNNKSSLTTNYLFKYSTFLHFFDDSKLIQIYKDKHEKPSIIYKEYINHKFDVLKNNSCFICYAYSIVIAWIVCLSTMYSDYYINYDITNTIINKYKINGIFLFLKFLCCLAVFTITNNIRNNKKRTVNEVLLIFIFSIHIILLQIQINIYNSEFIIFFIVEQNMIIIVSILNFLIPNSLVSLTIIIYVVSFGISIGVGFKQYLVVQYTIVSFIILIMLVVIRIAREYISTFEYLENKIHTEELKAREKLLFNLMPPPVVKHLKEDIPVVDVIQNVTMLYTDICGFTDFSKAQNSPKNVVRMLIELFKRFDDAVIRNDVYKVHTIGDCYVVLGYTGKLPDNERELREEALKVINIGQEMISIIKEVAATKEVNFPGLSMRIGIHTVRIIC